MKRNSLYFLIFICVQGFGCNLIAEEDALPEGPYDLLGLEGEKIIYVADRLEACVSVAIQQCMLVKEKLSDPWEFWYSGIADFHYVAGTNYVLRIVEKPISNPPQDGSAIEWQWIETLDRW